jgi:hypothetical protein
VVRAIGLDLHRDFCEVAILALFAQSIAPDDNDNGVVLGLQQRCVGRGRRAAPRGKARRGMGPGSGAVQRRAQDGDGLRNRGARRMRAAERVEHHEVVRDAVVADRRHRDAGRARSRAA